MSKLFQGGNCCRPVLFGVHHVVCYTEVCALVLPV